MAARSPHSTTFSPAWRRLERASKKKPNTEAAIWFARNREGTPTVMSTNRHVRKIVSRELLRDEKIHSRTRARACFDRLLDVTFTNDTVDWKMKKPDTRDKYQLRTVHKYDGDMWMARDYIFDTDISISIPLVDGKRERAQSLESNLRSRNFLWPPDTVRFAEARAGTRGPSSLPLFHFPGSHVVAARLKTKSSLGALVRQIIERVF